MAKRTGRGRDGIGVVGKAKALVSGSEARPEGERAVPDPIETASSSVGTPRKPTKGPSKRARSARPKPTTDPNMRTIGERVLALREEAEILALDLQEPEDEFEDEGDEDREADMDAALGLMEVMKEVEHPSPAVAALVVEYRPRPDWPPLDRARDVRDELEKIDEVFRAGGIEDEGFEACLEELHGWMYEF